MPAVAPPPYPIPEPVVSQCVATASRTYGVPELVIRSILKVEGGQVGTMSRNTNGSFDLGPMQINTINLKIINKEYPFLTWRHITYNRGVYTMVDASCHGSRVRWGGGVGGGGVGDYHSGAPSKRSVYLQRFLGHYNRLKKQYGFTPARVQFTQPAEPVQFAALSDERAVPTMPIPAMLARTSVSASTKDAGKPTPSFAAFR